LTARSSANAHPVIEIAAPNTAPGATEVLDVERDVVDLDLDDRGRKPRDAQASG